MGLAGTAEKNAAEQHLPITIPIQFVVARLSRTEVTVNIKSECPFHRRRPFLARTSGSPRSLPTYDLPFSTATTHPGELNRLGRGNMGERTSFHAHTEGHTRPTSVPLASSGPHNEWPKICTAPRVNLILLVLSLQFLSDSDALDHRSSQKKGSKSELDT